MNSISLKLNQESGGGTALLSLFLIIVAIKYSLISIAMLMGGENGVLVFLSLITFILAGMNFKGERPLFFLLGSLSYVGISFPFSLNHDFLLVYIGLILFICQRVKETPLQALRWLYLSMWFFSGVQKIFHQDFILWGPLKFGLVELGFMKWLPFQDKLGIIVALIEILMPLLMGLLSYRGLFGVLPWLILLMGQISLAFFAKEWGFGLVGGLYALYLAVNYKQSFKFPCQRKLRVILIVLFIWPFLHMGLSSAFSFSPWRLGGWGMYAKLPATQVRDISFLIEETSLKFHNIPWRNPKRSRRMRYELLEFPNSKRYRQRLISELRSHLRDQMQDKPIKIEIFKKNI